MKDSAFLSSSPDDTKTGDGRDDSKADVKAVDEDESMDTSTLDDMDKDMDASTSVNGTKVKERVNKKGKLTSRSHLLLTLKQTLEEAEKAGDPASDGEEAEPDTTMVAPLRHRMDEPMYFQLMDWIENQGPTGVTKHNIREAFGFHSLKVRNIIKYLYKNKCVHFFYCENKRQKVERLCAKKYASMHENEIHELQAKQCIQTPSSSTAPDQVETTPETAADTPHTGDEKVKSDSNPTRRNVMTSKMAERRRTVTNLALEHKLILFADLAKLMQTAEAEKYDTKMDRKTLKRICEQLNNSNDIKIFKTTVQVESKTRDLFYVCEPSMTLDNKLMKSSLESQRSELTSSITSAKLPAKAQKAESKNTELKEEVTLPYTFNSSISHSQYGLAPKMKRAQVLHKFLCYAVYNYEGRTDAEEITEEFQMSDGEVIKLPVYSNTEDWKRFIPPGILTTQDNSDGVACLLDLGTQLPLQLFLKLVRLPYAVPEIIDLLADKIKSLIPVRCLPMSLQSILLYKKKYLVSLRETTCLLCMMGLATNLSTAEGGVTYRDVSVIYLHKLAAFVDTTDGFITDVFTAEQVAAKTQICKMNNGMSDVESFWIWLRNTCTSRAVPRFDKDKVKGLDEPEAIRHDMFRQPRLKEAHSPKTMDQVQEGVIPGDGRGAAGLDTLFFAHLHRQWLSAFEKMVPNPKRPTVFTADNPKEELHRKLSYSSQVTVIQTTVNIDSNSGTQPSPSIRSLRNKRANSDQRHIAKRLKLDPKVQKTAEGAKEKSKTLERRKRKYDARSAKDEKDYMAEEKLETQRSIFVPQEDEALMLAKIGLNILGCKEVATTFVRDFLHKSLPNLSRDKSSRSCWARMNRVLQFNMRARTMHLYTTIAMSDPEIAKYKDSAPTITPSFAETYSQLMDLVIRKCENASKSELVVDLSTVSGMDDLNSRYNLIVVAETQEVTRELTGHSQCHKISPPVEVSWKEPTNDVDIVKFTLTNFIMSYLLVNDKTRRTVQMYKVFDQYPPNMADVVLRQLQANKVATQRKTPTNQSIGRFGLTYRYRLFTERIMVVSSDVFDSCSEAISELENTGSSYHKYTDVDDWRGKLLMFLTLVPFQAIDIKFDLPEKVLDTSNVAQSDDEEDEEDDDLAEDSKTVSAKDKRCRMRYEHCQIKPCTVQACLNPQNIPDSLKATKAVDRKYIRTLMSSVPYNIQLSEELDVLLETCDTADRPILQALYDTIDKAGILGITLYNLHASLSEVHSCTMSSLLNCLRYLTNSQLVLSVGITERVYVTHRNCRTWVVHSLRDTKGRGSGVALDEKDKIKLSEAIPQENELHAIPAADPTQLVSTTYGRVDIIPKPWLTPEGTINYELLNQILSSVVATINKYQSINFKSLHRLFSMVYSQTLLLDLLQILEELGCVSCDYLTPAEKEKPSLFSKKQTFELSKHPLRPDSVAHYTVKHEAMQRISQFIHNTSQKHSSCKLKS